MKASGGLPARVLSAIQRVDKHTYVTRDEDGNEHIDAGWSAINNWDTAKMQYAVGLATAVFAGLGTIDYIMPNLIVPEWPAAVIAVVFGTASVGTTLLGIKNTVDASVWAVIAGAQRLFGGGAQHGASL